MSARATNRNKSKKQNEESVITDAHKTRQQESWHSKSNEVPKNEQISYRASYKMTFSGHFKCEYTNFIRDFFKPTLTGQALLPATLPYCFPALPLPKVMLIILYSLLSIVS